MYCPVVDSSEYVDICRRQRIHGSWSIPHGHVCLCTSRCLLIVSLKKCVRKEGKMNDGPDTYKSTIHHWSPGKRNSRAAAIRCWPCRQVKVKPLGKNSSGGSVCSGFSRSASEACDWPSALFNWLSWMTTGTWWPGSSRAQPSNLKILTSRETLLGSKRVRCSSNLRCFNLTFAVPRKWACLS